MLVPVVESANDDRVVREIDDCAYTESPEELARTEISDADRR
jgi:hypothetical protein